jgi:formiminotetrahydrofolate cyclodeaminase
MSDPSQPMPKMQPETLATEDEARRAFLKKAGRFAAVTPPAITMLLGTSLSSRAIAASNGNAPKKPKKEKKPK